MYIFQLLVYSHSLDSRSAAALVTNIATLELLVQGWGNQPIKKRAGGFCLTPRTRGRRIMPWQYEGRVSFPPAVWMSPFHAVPRLAASGA